MAYEYEKDIPEFLKGIETEHPLELSKEIKEVREVYRKARAFDEILNLPDTYGYAEDYAEDVDIILSEYMEDE